MIASVQPMLAKNARTDTDAETRRPGRRDATRRAIRRGREAREIRADITDGLREYATA